MSDNKYLCNLRVVSSARSPVPPTEAVPPHTQRQGVVEASQASGRGLAANYPASRPATVVNNSKTYSNWHIKGCVPLKTEILNNKSNKIVSPHRHTTQTFKLNRTLKCEAMISSSTKFELPRVLLETWDDWIYSTGFLVVLPPLCRLEEYEDPPSSTGSRC